MQHVFVAGDQPVPGYRLLEELEGSAFSKVWRVSTPEGGERWWKIVDLVVGNAAIETRTLGLLVRLRHPCINTLTNFWNLDDGKTLIVESEVPQGSLRRLLQKRQGEGLSGLSFEEALEYITHAAEGLDFLNKPQHEYNGQQVAIHHRALRPESLVLFEEGGRVVCRVSDFGLSKPVTEEVAAHSQGLLHYDYDPPEFFEGQTSPTSDQFSLALVYYELRTGQMPFRGTMLEQLQARLNDKPELSGLGELEQSILRKALSRDPHLRFKSCSELVRHLREGLSPTGEGGGSRPGDSKRLSTLPPVEVTAPRPSGTNIQSPGWRSTAAAMQGTPIDSTLSATLTPPPRAQRTFQRPKTDSALLRESKTDSSLLRESVTQTPSPTLTPPPGMRLSPGRPILNPTPRSINGADPSSPPVHETHPASVDQTTPAPKPTLRTRQVPKGVDLKSIREHLASTSFSSVDTYTGERKVPLTWVAIILAVTALGTVWLSNHLVP
jgi:serine/threonine protein kinase